MFAVLRLSCTSLAGVQLANRLVAERGRCYKPSRLSELAPSRTRQNNFVLTLYSGRGMLDTLSKAVFPHMLVSISEYLKLFILKKQSQLGFNQRPLVTWELVCHYV